MNTIVPNFRGNFLANSSTAESYYFETDSILGMVNTLRQQAKNRIAFSNDISVNMDDNVRGIMKESALFSLRRSYLLAREINDYSGRIKALKLILKIKKNHRYKLGLRTLREKYKRFQTELLDSLDEMQIDLEGITMRNNRVHGDIQETA